MNIETYIIYSENNFEVFEFISEGPKGRIHKLIHFQQTEETELYNLAFGDKSALGEIDDLAISNNNDTEKVLATVIKALYIFFEKHPDVFVYVKGSTPSRTRLYRMGIHKFYRKAIKDFYLFGQSGNHFYEFAPGSNYDGFLVQRKFN